MRKQNLKRLMAMVLSLTMIFGMEGGGLKGIAVSAEATSADKTAEECRNVVIDGDTVLAGENQRYRGIGAVTCNNSSRLLMDYKSEHPEDYWNIMTLLFDKEKGSGLTHVKIELGCDLDSSSGAEPATKRTEEEAANVVRGFGFQFAADAKKINPDVTIDLLRWGEPSWVTQAVDSQGNITRDAIFAARYKWFKETIDAIYNTYGIQVDYVGAAQNEKSVSFPKYNSDGSYANEKDNVILWTVYLRDALDHEKVQAYDYSKIKIVACDEVDAVNVAKYMLYDQQYPDNPGEDEAAMRKLAVSLRNAVDVVSSHYMTCFGDAAQSNLDTLIEEYGKEVWLSEGSSSTTVSADASNSTTEGAGMTGANGVLNIANRIISAYVNAGMTMYEYQPSVAAYYDGAIYYPKQMMTANTPWSGYYEVDACTAMTMQFTSFINQGWEFVKSGSYAAAKESDHVITETNENMYMTAMDPETGDYSTIITNDSAKERTYTFQVNNTAKSSAAVHIWETREAEEGQSTDANWLQEIQTITPVKSGEYYTYSYTVKPYSIVTITTTDGQESFQKRIEGTKANQEREKSKLNIQYADDFEYSSFAADYLAGRGGTPRYTTDANGALEVVKDETGNQVLRQIIDNSSIPTAWYTDAWKCTETSLGDDSWADYTVSADVRLAQSKDAENYVAIAARYNSFCTTLDNKNKDSIAKKNGYWLKLYEDGSWELVTNNQRKDSETNPPLAMGATTVKSGWNELKLQVYGREITAWINNIEVAKVTVSEYISASGRVGLSSAYYPNEFDNLQVTPVAGGTAYVERYDDLADELTFSNGWIREDQKSYRYEGRSYSKTMKANETMQMTFHGTGFHIIGCTKDLTNSDKAVVNISVDGVVVAENVNFMPAYYKEAVYMLSGLSEGTHSLQLTTVSGNCLIDAVEILNNNTAVTSPITLPAKQSSTNQPQPQPQETPDHTKLEKVSGGLKYKVVGSSVVVSGVSKKSVVSVKIADTIKINGKSYKVTEIQKNAFKGCSQLKSVTIGKNVKKIGNSAFLNCKKLNKISLKTTKLVSVGKNALKNCNKKLVIKCPKEPYKRYKKIFAKTKTGYNKTMKIKK